MFHVPIRMYSLTLILLFFTYPFFMVSHSSPPLSHSSHPLSHSSHPLSHSSHPPSHSSHPLSHSSHPLSHSSHPPSHSSHPLSHSSHPLSHSSPPPSHSSHPLSHSSHPLFHSSHPFPHTQTDDDTYVNLPLLLSELTARCRMPKCRNEALYVGQEARRTQVGFFVMVYVCMCGLCVVCVCVSWCQHSRVGRCWCCFSFVVWYV